MKVKKIIALIVLCVMMVSLFGCNSEKTNESQSTTGEKKETYTIRLSFLGTEDTSYAIGPKKMVEEMNKKAGYDAFELKLYTIGQLGSSDQENCELVNNGTAEMTFTANDGLMYLNGSLNHWNIVSVPFIFPSMEIADAFWDTDMGKELLKEASDATNLIVYPGFVNGSSILGSNKGEIHVPSDIAGQKIRTTASQFIVKSVEAWGASSFNVAYTEIYSALQQKTVDGMINGLSSWWATAGGEVCKYGTVVNSYYNINNPVVNKDWYNSLPDDLKSIFDEGMSSLVSYIRGDRTTFLELYRQELEKQGMKIYDLTDEERQEWVKATEPVIGQVADLVGGEEYIQKAKECIAQIQ